MKHKVAAALVAVVLVSGCAQVVESLNRFESVEYNYRHEIELQTSDMDTAQEVTQEIRRRHNNMGIRSVIGVKPNQSTENVRYYIKTVNRSKEEIKRSFKKFNLSIEVPFKVSQSRTLNLTDPVRIDRQGEQVEISETKISEGETLKVQNYTFELTEVGKKYAIIDIEVFDRSHIIGTGKTMITGTPTGYSGSLSVILSKKGSKRLYNVFQNYQASREFLQFIDGEKVRMKTKVQGREMSKFRVYRMFKSNMVQQFSLTAVGDTRNEVESKIDQYELALSSTPLETDIEYVGVEKVDNSIN